MNVELTLGIIGIVANVLVALALAYVGMKVARIEKLEDKLEASAAERIDARFSAMAGECRLRHGGIDREVAAINERLGRGDERFGELGDGKVEAKLTVLAAIAELKDQMARREDVELLKREVGVLSGRLDGLQRMVARDLEESRKK